MSSKYDNVSPTKNYNQLREEEEYDVADFDLKEDIRRYDVDDADGECQSNLPTYVSPRNDHHKFRKTREKYERFESLNYDSILNDPLIHEKTNSERDQMDFFIRCMICGILVAFACFFLEIFNNHLIQLKLSIVLDFIAKGQMYSAIFFYLLISLSFFCISFCLVVFVKPIAGGGGLAEIKAYLNGTNILNLFSPSTGFVKLIGSAFSIASGIFIGVEAPAIHIGGVIGAYMAHLPHFEDYFLRGSKIQDKWFLKFRNDRSKRDLISCGLAAGVSASFLSPVGGICFVIEEATTFWSMQMTMLAFMTSMCSGLVMITLVGTFNEETQRYYLSKMGVFTDTSMNFLDSYHFIILFGIIMGLVGSYFNCLNPQVLKFRQRYKDNFRLKLLDNVCVLLLTVSLKIIVPYVFEECMPTKSSYNCSSHDITTFYSNSNMDGNNFLRYNCEVHNYWTRFTCPEGTESPVATLFFSENYTLLKGLFHNTGDYGIVYLSFYAVVLFIVLVFTYGLTVPMGFFVPCMMLGAVTGRLYVEVLLAMFPGLNLSGGVFALIGAASMLTGIMRLTLTPVVIFFEITNQSFMNIPLMMSVLITKIVGEYFNPNILEILMDLNKIPYVEEDATECMWYMTARDVMSVNPIGFKRVEKVDYILHVLKTNNHNGFPVVGNKQGIFLGIITRDQLYNILLKGNQTTIELKDTAELTSFNKRSRDIIQSKDDEFNIEIIENKDDPITYTKNVLHSRSNVNAELMTPQQEKEWEETPHKKKMEKLSFANMEKNTLHYYEFAKRMDNRNMEFDFEKDYGHGQLDMRSYINKASISVMNTCPMGRVYELFRCLGLRHLAVTNTNYKIVGIITRKDLMNEYKHDME